MKYLICSYGNGIAVGIQAEDDTAMETERNCLYNFAGVKTQDYLFDGVALFPSVLHFYKYLVKKEWHAHMGALQKHRLSGREALREAFAYARMVWEENVSRYSFMHAYTQSRRSYQMGSQKAENLSDNDS